MILGTIWTNISVGSLQDVFKARDHEHLTPMPKLCKVFFMHYQQLFYSKGSEPLCRKRI